MTSNSVWQKMVAIAVGTNAATERTGTPRRARRRTSEWVAALRSQLVVEHYELLLAAGY